jgi:hypothetical protein
MTPKWKVPVTAAWSAKLPDDFVRIGISRGPPRGQCGYRMFSHLKPGPWFRTVPPKQFHKLYMAQLADLDPERVLAELNTLAAGKTPALLCFEPPPPDPRWCHRGWVAGWLKDTLDLDVFEYGHEDEGAGWSHPKLPPFLRR